jgi:hypothetical protein
MLHKTDKDVDVVEHSINYKINSKLYIYFTAFSGQTQHRLHELIVIDLDPSTIVRIEPPKRLAQLFDHDASANETIEGDTRRMSALNNGSCPLSIPDGEV